MADIFTNLFSTLGSSISSNPLAAIGTGAGLLSNISSDIQNKKITDAEIARQKYLYQLANNPAQLNAMISNLEQPLSADLTKSVGNQVQGYLAERGLSQTPGISAEVLAQALAPYQQQQEQLASNEAFGILGVGNGATPTHTPQPINLSGILSYLQPQQTTKPSYNSSVGLNPYADSGSFPGFTFNPGASSQIPDVSGYVSPYTNLDFNIDPSTASGAFAG